MRVLEQGNPLQVAPEPLVALRSPPCPFVDFFFGRRGSAFTPHRISLRPTARLLRLPLKGGAIGLGARASRPHPCSLWGLLSISATLQAATTSAGTATAGSKESQGAVGSIQVREKAEAVPGLVRAGRPRSQEAFDRTINRGISSDMVYTLPGNQARRLMHQPRPCLATPPPGGSDLEACKWLLARTLGKVSTLFPVYGVKDVPGLHPGPEAGGGKLAGTGCGRDARAPRSNHSPR